MKPPIGPYSSPEQVRNALGQWCRPHEDVGAKYGKYSVTVHRRRPKPGTILLVFVVIALALCFFANIACGA